jgi:hypothetical protein
VNVESGGISTVKPKNSERNLLQFHFICHKPRVALPNVVVEWLTFLLRIWYVPGSNRGTETGYPD